MSTPQDTSAQQGLLLQYLTPERRRWLILVAAAGMVVYLALALVVDARQIGHALGRLGTAGVAAVLGLSLFNYLLRFARWNWYVHALGHQVPWLRHLGYYIGGFAFTVSPGKAGESVRSLYLSAHGVPFTHSLAALFSERLLDALAVTALAVLIIASGQDYRMAVIGAALAFGGVTLLAGRGYVPALLRRLAAPMHGRMHGLLVNLALLFEASATLLRTRYLLPGLLLGLLAWGAEGYGLYVLAAHMGVGIDHWSGAGIYALAVLAGAASFFMPGGLGGTEAAMTALLVAAGAPVPAAFAVTVLCRLATLWFAVMLGIIALALVEGSALPKAAA